jgi:fucose 4-O-acetylase-like acetyltransferase
LRNTYIDFLKGCLIFLVILGHSLQYSTYYDVNSFWTNKTFIAIYTFHMPLFIGVSGYLFTLPKNYTSFFKILYNKVPRLMLPVFSWAVLYMVLVNVTDISSINLYKVLHIFVNSLWFVWVLLACILTVLFGSYLRYGYIFYVIFIFIAFEYIEYWFFNEYLYLLPFFILGMKFKDFKLDINHKLIVALANKTVISIMAIYAVLSIQLWSYDDFIYNSNVDFKNTFLYIFRFFTAINNSILFIIFTRFIVKKLPVFLKNGVIEIGAKSLVLYALSSYIQPKIKPMFELTSNTGSAVFYSIILSIVVSLCFLFVARFVFKFKLSKFLFIGKS